VTGVQTCALPISRSSALASKATGYPIAKIAAKLAVGYTLDELPNDITGKTVACFEPTIDYVVTKIPRWTFEKFPEADETLTTQMKSVGEAMSIGRTFKESLQKGIRSMEVKRFGLGLDANDKWLAARRHEGERAERDEETERRRDGGQGGATCEPEPSAPSDIEWPIDGEKLIRKLSVPSQGRLYYIRYAFKMGWTLEQIHERTKIDPWFLDQIQQLVAFEDELLSREKLEDVDAALMSRAKQLGYSDPQLAHVYLGRITSETILQVRAYRQKLGVKPVYKLVDTCAAEFEAETPYYYSTYEGGVTTVSDEEGAEGRHVGTKARRHEGPDAGAGAASPSCLRASVPSSLSADDEVRVTDRKKILILGGGPNRIGQGIEFDYCCVQAAYAADELGYESVMVNSNPETVSTDYDTSDLLFFEPLTLEDVLNICERLNGAPLQGRQSPGRERGHEGNLLGAIVQFGGQTPLNLAHGLELAGVPIIGTPVDSIDLAEDRERFQKLLNDLKIKQPDNGIAFSLEEARDVAQRIGYPVLVRPSYVLGGRGMETCFSEEQLLFYMRTAVDVSDLADAPVLIDKFLAEAIEVDVDVVADHGRTHEGAKAPRNGGAEAKTDEETNRRTDEQAGGAATGEEASVPSAYICGVMEHIEEAGVHSGDSACAIPPYSLPEETVKRLIDQSRRMAEALNVCGLMNVQYAITRPHAEGERHEIYVLEVNPRASRTVPFVSKATGVSWARVAAKAMAGVKLAELDIAENYRPGHTSVKESVFPFSKFPGVDIILGPEMRSTGEVMGADVSYPVAFAKSQMAAGTTLPRGGDVFFSLRSSDKTPTMLDVARQLAELGFKVYSTRGTADWLRDAGIGVTQLNKISEGEPNALHLIQDGKLTLIINTPTQKGMKTDEGHLRAAAVRFNVPIVTTTTGAAAAVRAIAALRAGAWGVKALQDHYPDYRNGELKS